MPFSRTPRFMGIPSFLKTRHAVHGCFSAKPSNNTSQINKIQPKSAADSTHRTSPQSSSSSSPLMSIRPRAESISAFLKGANENFTSRDFLCIDGGEGHVFFHHHNNNMLLSYTSASFAECLFFMLSSLRFSMCLTLLQEILTPKKVLGESARK